jgi:hypothetical protein
MLDLNTNELERSLRDQATSASHVDPLPGITGGEDANAKGGLGLPDDSGEGLTKPLYYIIRSQFLIETFNLQAGSAKAMGRQILDLPHLKNRGTQASS